MNERPGESRDAALTWLPVIVVAVGFVALTIAAFLVAPASVSLSAPDLEEVVSQLRDSDVMTPWQVGEGRFLRANAVFDLRHGVVTLPVEVRFRNSQAPCFARTRFFDVLYRNHPSLASLADADRITALQTIALFISQRFEGGAPPDFQPSVTAEERIESTDNRLAEKARIGKTRPGQWAVIAASLTLFGLVLSLIVQRWSREQRHKASHLPWSNLDVVLLLEMVFVGLVLRKFPDFWPRLDGDELAFLVPLPWDSLLNQAESGVNPPLYPLISVAILAFTDHLFLFRLFSTLAGLALIAVVYAFVRSTISRRVAVASALFVTLGLGFVAMNQLARVYSLLMLVQVAAAWMLLSGMQRRDSRRLIAGSCLMASGFWLHYSHVVVWGGVLAFCLGGWLVGVMRDYLKPESFAGFLELKELLERWQASKPETPESSFAWKAGIAATSAALLPSAVLAPIFLRGLKSNEGVDYFAEALAFLPPFVNVVTGWPWWLAGGGIIVTLAFRKGQLPPAVWLSLVICGLFAAQTLGFQAREPQLRYFACAMPWMVVILGYVTASWKRWYLAVGLAGVTTVAIASNTALYLLNGCHPLKGVPENAYELQDELWRILDEPESGILVIPARAAPDVAYLLAGALPHKGKVVKQGEEGPWRKVTSRIKGRNLIIAGTNHPLADYQRMAELSGSDSVLAIHYYHWGESELDEERRGATPLRIETVVRTKNGGLEVFRLGRSSGEQD